MISLSKQSNFIVEQWNAEGGVPYNLASLCESRVCLTLKVRLFEPTRVCQRGRPRRIVNGVKLASAWGEFLWNFGLRSVILRM